MAIKKLPKNWKFLGPKPRDYQVETILYGMYNTDIGNLLGLGLGKTKCSIDIARYRIQYHNIKKVLVVCPASLLYNWKKEIEKWSEYEAIILNATKKERIKRATSTKYKFSIINYESLFPLLKDFNIAGQIERREKKHFIVINTKNLSKLNFDMIIFDESARYLKNPKSNRTESSIILSDYAKYHLILTGTLIGNKPLDLWPQFRALDGGATFGNNPYAFRNKFFLKVDYGNYSKFELKKEYVGTIQRCIQRKCIRFTKEECLDLPDRLYHTITLPLEGSFKKIYKEVEKKVITEIETLKGTTYLNIKNILNKLLRLQQITGGFASEGPGTEAELKDTPKLDAIIEEIETITDVEESVVIWCKFRFSIDLIKNRLKKLGIPCIILDGRVTDKKEKYDRWRNFQKSKDINVFISQTTSGGFGIELFKENADETKTQNMIFYEHFWTPDVRDQAMGRIHRMGQVQICRYVDIIIEKTIDPRILSVVKDKKEIADLIMNFGVRKLLEG